MKQTGRARVSFRTMTYSELEIPFHKRLKIQMLMNNESSSYLMELLKNEHCDFYSDSAKEKWFSGKRIFPEYDAASGERLYFAGTGRYSIYPSDGDSTDTAVWLYPDLGHGTAGRGTDTGAKLLFSGAFCQCLQQQF